MQLPHNQTGDGLCEERLHSKRDGEIAGPFVKKQADWLKAYLTAANPGTDNGQEDRHQKNSAQNIDHDVGIKAVILIHDLPGHPFCRSVRQQHQDDNAEPYKWDNP